MSFFMVTKNGIEEHSVDTNQYDGGKTQGSLDSWETLGSDPNAFIKETYGTLCDRNTTLYHTFAAARAVVNKPLDYIIGEGLHFKSEINGELIGLNKEEAVSWSKQFSQLLHYAKKDIKYYDKQKVLFRQACITGDVILYFLREDNGRPFDLIVSGGYDIDWQKTGENIKLGVKLDGASRPLGFYKKSDGKYVKFADDNGNLNALMFMLEETAGQVRGMGCFYSEIARAKGFDRVWDATLARMTLESIIMGYFASDEDGARQLRQQALRAKGLTNATAAGVETVANATELQPGNMLQFNSQGSMKFNDLKTPSKNFGDANEYYMSLFSMARGYPKAFITGQYDASYSAGRSVLNDAMKRVRPERKVFINKVDTPVNLEFLKYFASKGMIWVPDSFWTNNIVQQIMVEGIHIGPEPEAINPLQESMADKKNVDEGFLTREVVARKKGIDFDNTIDDWKQQNEKHLEGSPVALLKAFEAKLITKGNDDEDN